MNSIDQQFVEFIVKSLVSKPDEVKIERKIDEKGVLLELTVDPEDLGRVIGKRGATAQSLRTLLRALGTKNDARYNLKIVDNGEGAPAAAPASDSSAPQDDQASNDDQPSSEENVADAETSEPSSSAEAEPKEAEPKEDEGKEKRDDDSIASRTRRELADLDDLDV